MWTDFKAFITRGNVIDLAVAFILGAAFTTIVRSFVADIIMPPIGLIFGSDFSNIYTTLKEGTPAGPYASLMDAQAAGAVTMNWGVFISSVVAFLIVAFVMFLLIRWMMRLQNLRKVPAPEAAPSTKECPFCFSTISIAATRCPACTSDLAAATG